MAMTQRMKLVLATFLTAFVLIVVGGVVGGVSAHRPTTPTGAATPPAAVQAQPASLTPVSLGSQPPREADRQQWQHEERHDDHDDDDDDD